MSNVKDYVNESRSKAKAYLAKTKAQTTQRNWRDSVGYIKLVNAQAAEVYKEFQRQKNGALKVYNQIAPALEKWSKKEYPDIWEKRLINIIVIPPAEESEILEKISDKDRRLINKFIKSWDANVKPKKITRILQAWAVKAGVAGGSHALKVLGVNLSFNLRDKNLLKALMSRGTKITGGITKKTLKDFQNILVKSYVEKGISPYEVRKQIKYLFEETYKHRAMAIARTETGVASSTVQHATYKNNKVKKKRWFALADDRTRESHAFTDGQEQLIDDPFDVMGVLMMHPHDSAAPADEVINCRCDEDAIVETKIVDASAWTGG